MPQVLDHQRDQPRRAASSGGDRGAAHVGRAVLEQLEQHRLGLGDRAFSERLRRQQPLARLRGTGQLLQNPQRGARADVAQLQQPRERGAPHPRSVVLHEGREQRRRAFVPQRRQAAQQRSQHQRLALAREALAQRGARRRGAARAEPLDGVTAHLERGMLQPFQQRLLDVRVLGLLEQVQREDHLGRQRAQQLAPQQRDAGGVVEHERRVVHDAPPQHVEQRPLVGARAAPRHQRPQREVQQQHVREAHRVVRDQRAHQQHDRARDADRDRREHHLDRDLRGQPLLRLQRLVEHLERRVVDRVLERLVDALVRDHQPEHERAARVVADGAVQHDQPGAGQLDERQHQQSDADAVALEQRPREEQPREQRQPLRQPREHAEEAGQLLHVGVTRAHLLEEREVDEVLAQHRQHRDPRDDAQVAVARDVHQLLARAAHRPPGLGRRRLRVRDQPQHQRRQQRAQQQAPGRQPHQVRHPDQPHEERHRERARDAGHDLAGADQPEQALGLAHVVEPRRHRPELEVGQDRQHAVPHERREAEPGRRRELQAEAERAHGHEQEQRRACHQLRERDALLDPRVDRAGGDVQQRRRDVHPGQRLAFELRQEQRRGRGLEEHGRAAHEERVADHQQRGAAFAGVDPEEGEQPAHAGLLRRRARTPASGTS
jgi:hypothetical protein